MKRNAVVASGVVCLFLTLLLAQPGAAGRVRTADVSDSSTTLTPQGTGKNDQIQGQGVQATTEGYKQSDGTSDYYKGPAYGPVSEDDTEEEGDKPKDHDAHWRPTPKYPRFEKDDRDERHGGMGATSGTTGMATGTTTGMMTGTMTGMMTGTMTGTARGPTTGMTGTTTMQGTHPAQTTGMVMMRDTGHTLATRRMSCTFTQSQDMHTTTQTTHNTMATSSPHHQGPQGPLV